MTNHKLLRLTAVVLCLILCLSLLSDVTVLADDEIWVEAPTGWVHSSHVLTRRVDGHLCNWGVRGETALFLSGNALSYYSDNEWGVGASWGWFMGQEYEGGTGAEDAMASPLYRQLHSFLDSKQTHQPSYAETMDLFQYTDCMASNPEFISSFYSGRKLDGTWDGGSTWNPEHIWPSSKASGDQNDDILMLRPTSTGENSGRGDLAYGESSGYYNPNTETDGNFDLRGDCARICLYCYVRRSENAGSMWGTEGVFEDPDVLLSWMAQDPVDTWEMGRNDATADITGVRNVFVDYPELAWKLFGREVPCSYPTPMNGGQEWPPASAVSAAFSAVPDDPAHGSVAVSGLCATPEPAEGWYASGYDVIFTGSWWVDPEATNPYSGLLKWDRWGRLLCTVTREIELSVTIHFTPIGETDPCPTGHDWDGGAVTAAPSVGADGVRTFTCSRCGRTRSAVIPFRFSDVTSPEAYFYEPVYWALHTEPRITAGVDDFRFCPLRTCTRAEVVTFLWRAAGESEPKTANNPFKDVKKTDFFYKAVLWAVEQGITKGTSSTTFAPRNPCSRGEVVTLLWRAMSNPALNSAANPFRDVKEGDYFYNAVLWAVENGVTYGVNATHFCPGKACTRGEVVTFLYRALGSEESRSPVRGR